jgi:farnesyl diphosphate synthase
MDDDDLRRGQPTTHRKFDEATAILTGDALVVLAFELLSSQVPSCELAVKMVAELASATGCVGMIGGQSADLAGQSEPTSLDRTQMIHEQKTARLIAAACRLGAIAGGGDAVAVDRLGEFGTHLGRAFQITDDLLDVTASAGEMGKAVGKDAVAGKQTYPRCVGIDESRKAAEGAVASAVVSLSGFAAADDLRSLAEYVVSRNY